MEIYINIELFLKVIFLDDDYNEKALLRDQNNQNFILHSIGRSI